MRLAGYAGLSIPVLGWRGATHGVMVFMFAIPGGSLGWCGVVAGASPCVLWRLAPQCVCDGPALRSLVVGARSGVRGQFALRDLTWFKPLCVSSVGRAESRCGAVHTSDEVMRFSSPLGGFRWRRSTTEFSYNRFEQGIRSFVRLPPLRYLTVV